jgi:hypothetical protein
MTKDEIRVYTKRQGGVFEYIYYYQANPVWLPEDAPAEVKCAWMRLYNQGTKDVELIEGWLNADRTTT